MRWGLERFFACVDGHCSKRKLQRCFYYWPHPLRSDFEDVLRYNAIALPGEELSYALWQILPGPFPTWEDYSNSIDVTVLKLIFVEGVGSWRAW
jgi:hypothetical protein